MARPSLSPQDVARYLAVEGLTVRVLDRDTSTAPLAAEALGTTVDTIVKSLLFMAGLEPVLVLAAGNRRVQPAALCRHLDAPEVRLARPAEVLDITGYEVGGVPPVAHRRALRIVMDRHLFDQPLLYAAAGAANTIFAVSPDHLLHMTRAETGDVTD